MKVDEFAKLLKGFTNCFIIDCDDYVCSKCPIGASICDKLVDIQKELIENEEGETETLCPDAIPENPTDQKAETTEGSKVVEEIPWVEVFAEYFASSGNVMKLCRGYSCSTDCPIGSDTCEKLIDIRHELQK